MRASTDERHLRNPVVFSLRRARTRPGLLVVAAAVTTLVVLLTDVDPARATEDPVDLYGVFETTVKNDTDYDNPFDFREIELQATFTSPSGEKHQFFGFYAGDGKGGQDGDVWKLRFMPDETGKWTYTYSWTDDTKGGSGTFRVVDTGLPGPLQIDENNSWYFQTARGLPFHARLYDMHHWQTDPDHDYANETAKKTYDDQIRYMKNRVFKGGYNMTMIGDNYDWWKNDEIDRFNISAWYYHGKVMEYCRKHGIYLFRFDYISQSDIPQFAEPFSDFKPFLRYLVARWAPYYNFLGYSLTWEWKDVWSESEIDERMAYVQKITPWEVMVANHDVGTDEMNWTPRQDQTRNVFDGNSRTDGKHGGVDDPSEPVVGSEDIWEISAGNFGSPRNRKEVRRGGWGEMMAGVMPLYSEMTKWMDDSNWGEGEGEQDIQKMFDFFYARTRYRQYEMLNSLVDSGDGEICSGIPGKEYLVYEQNVDSVSIDLSGADSKTSFDVIWFDPAGGTLKKKGTVDGGETRTIQSPLNSKDGVLFLTADSFPTDRTAPSLPMFLTAERSAETEITLDWKASRDAESGVDHYNVYRDGGKVGSTSKTTFVDSGRERGRTYEYEVSAVNGAGTESTRAGPVRAATAPDSDPPSIETVRAVHSERVDVTFSERVEQSSAADTSNYEIDRGVSVQNASVTGKKSVKLSVTPLEPGSYELTVRGVRDRSKSGNATDASVTFQYAPNSDGDIGGSDAFGSSRDTGSGSARNRNGSGCTCRSTAAPPTAGRLAPWAVLILLLGGMRLVVRRRS